MKILYRHHHSHITTTTLPAIITSVARLIPSANDSRHPYRLSNLDFVTESFTLNAGNNSLPSSCIWYRRCTPVVVSSDTPRTSSATRCQRVASSAKHFLQDSIQLYFIFCVHFLIQHGSIVFQHHNQRESSWLHHHHHLQSHSVLYHRGNSKPATYTTSNRQAFHPSMQTQAPPKQRSLPQHGLVSNIYYKNTNVLQHLKQPMFQSERLSEWSCATIP